MKIPSTPLKWKVVKNLLQFFLFGHKIIFVYSHVLTFIHDEECQENTCLLSCLFRLLSWRIFAKQHQKEGSVKKTMTRRGIGFFEVSTSSFLFLILLAVLLVEGKVISKLSWLCDEIGCESEKTYQQDSGSKFKWFLHGKSLSNQGVKDYEDSWSFAYANGNWLENLHNQIRKIFDDINHDWLFDIFQITWRPLHDKNWLIIFNYERTNKQMMDDIFGDGEEQQILVHIVYRFVCLVYT